MNKNIVFSLFLLSIAFSASAQKIKNIGFSVGTLQVDTNYYEDINFTKEVDEKEANFSEIICSYFDGKLTKEAINLHTNEIVSRSSYKNLEPVGIWIKNDSGRSRILDYDFELTYIDSSCCIYTSQADGKYHFNNHSEDDTTLQEIPFEKFNEFLQNNLTYPPEIKEKEISGIVLVRFVISRKGELRNIYVNQGLHVLADKEVVRVLRLLKFSDPPPMDEDAPGLCLTLPVKFAQ